MSGPILGSTPIYAPGTEPLPPGVTEQDREQYQQMLKMERYTKMAMDSCLAKTAMAGVAGKLYEPPTRNTF